MKSTGIVRKVDELGRIVIPMELRKTIGIEVKDSMEIFLDDDKIILQKYKPSKECVITGISSQENISLLGGKIYISEEGLKELHNLLENLPIKA